MKPSALALVVGGAVSSGLVCACVGDGGEVDPAPGRVLIVGIDGASLERIRPLMADGRLPHLKRVADAGAAGPLRSLMPLLSPRIWTSVATGKTPEEHGVTSWVTPDESGTADRLMNSHDRRVHGLWNILSDAGLSVATVNWLMTYPVEPIRGVVISDLALPGSQGARRELWLGEPAAGPAGDDAPTTHPPAWRGSVETVAAVPAGQLTSVPDPFLGETVIPKNSRRLSRSAYERDETVARIALEVEERTRPDVMMVLLQGIDRTSHWLWGGFEDPEAYPARKRFTPEERTAAAEALLAYYDFTDELLGRLLERYDERDLVLVLSDHGFEPGNSMLRMSGVHETERSQDGVLFARGPGIAAGTTIPVATLSVLDVAPTVLAWLGLPLADDMPGRPASFLATRRPLRSVPTYETKPVPRSPFAPSGVEDDVIEELRGLGYVR